jgi:hypothetical protein
MVDTNINNFQYIFDHFIKVDWYRDQFNNLLSTKVPYEPHTVTKNSSGEWIVILKQIPDVNATITIKNKLNPLSSIQPSFIDYVESTTLPLTANNQFYFDKTNAKIFLKDVPDKQDILVTYSAIGKACISANMIYTEWDSDGNIIELLEELIRKTRTALDQIVTIGSAEALKIQLESQIESLVNIFNVIKNDVPLAQQLSAELSAKVIEANTAKTSIDESVANAKTLVDSINMTGNESKQITTVMWGSKQADGYYHYTWTHTMASTDINMTCFEVTSNGRELSFIKPIIKNTTTIEIVSDSNNETVIVASARAWGGVVSSLSAFNSDQLAEGVNHKFITPTQLAQIEDIINKQNKTDSALLTTDKTIVGGINENKNKIGELSESINDINTSITELTSDMNNQNTIFITDYNIDLTGITDCSGILSQAISDAVTTGKMRIYFPSNSIIKGGVNNKNSNIIFMFGSNVKLKSVWHFAVGSSPLITSTTDINYASSDSYVENVHIVGKPEFIDGGRLGCFMCKNCSVDGVKLSGTHDGIHIYFGTEDFKIGDIYSVDGRQYAGNTGAVFIDTIASDTTQSYRPKKININKVYIKNSYLNGLYLNIDGGYIGDLTVDTAGTINGVNCLKINKSNDIFIAKTKLKGSQGGDGCDVIDSDNITINTMETSNNIYHGFAIAGTCNNVVVKRLYTHHNGKDGARFYGSGYYELSSFDENNNGYNGVELYQVSGICTINGMRLNGVGSANYYSGINMTGCTGQITLNNINLYGYNLTNGRGIYADNCTGRTKIITADISNCATGVAINSANCSGFMLNEFSYSGNTLNQATLPADTIKGLGVA